MSGKNRLHYFNQFILLIFGLNYTESGLHKRVEIYLHCRHITIWCHYTLCSEKKSTVILNNFKKLVHIFTIFGTHYIPMLHFTKHIQN